MADITAYNSINNVDFSASTLWYKSLADIQISVSLNLQVDKKVTMKTEFKSATAIVTKNPDGSILSDGFEVISTDTTSFDTMRTATIPYTKLQEGTNTVRITITDEVPPNGKTGTSVYTHDIIVENRDSFKIDREYDFAKEYLISGSGTITNAEGFSVTTSNGVRKSMAIPRKAIEMDGRSKIKSIIVNGDKDTIGTCEKDVTVNKQEDMGDCYMQTIPFTDILTFQKIDKVQAINASDATR